MPREWYDYRSANRIENEEARTLYKSIVASKKPYFMRYIYPALMREYNEYTNNTNRNSLREFQETIEELLNKSPEELTERQHEFFSYYHNRMPVGTGDCVINRICRKFEERFGKYLSKRNSSTTFDYTILKNDAEYTDKQYYEIKRLYDDYNRRLANYSIFAGYERINEWDSHVNLQMMDAEFRKQCDEVCPNSDVLCNIVLDICYKKNATKRFAWNMCGKDIIHNLLEKNDYLISYPVLSKDGDIYYGGNTFKVETKRLEVIKE